MLYYHRTFLDNWLHQKSKMCFKNRKLATLLAFVPSAFFMLLFIQGWLPVKNVIDYSFQDLNYLSSDISDSKVACKIPKLDPWDPVIMNFKKQLKPLVCPQVQPFLTYVDDDGYLRYNETELDNLLDQNLSLVCNYNNFDKEIIFKNATKLLDDVVIVNCKYVHNGETFYQALHAHPVTRKNIVSPTENQLSVLVFLIDSTSRSSLLRNLPLTYAYTKNVMGMKFFSGNIC